MKYLVLIVSLLALASLACMNSANIAPTTTPFVRSNFIASPQVIVVTSTPNGTQTQVPPTNTPFNNNTSNNGGNTSGGSGTTCRVRTDWFTYAVQRGDTLAAVARATGSDITTLTQANCLSNPNNLDIGQILRVPRLPSATTVPTPIPVTAPPNPVIVGQVQFSEFISYIGDDITLPIGKTIVLYYPEAPANTQQVSFYIDSALMGTDNTIADGATMLWTVPHTLTGNTISAIAVSNNGTSYQASRGIRVYVSPATEGSVSVSPFITADAGNFQLQSGATVTVSYEGVRADVTRVEFNLYDPNTDGWSKVGFDANMGDGASVSWTVPYGLNEHSIFASAYNGLDIQVQTATSGSLYSSASQGVSFVP